MGNGEGCGAGTVVRGTGFAETVRKRAIGVAQAKHAAAPTDCGLSMGL